MITRRFSVPSSMLRLCASAVAAGLLLAIIGPVEAGPPSTDLRQISTDGKTTFIALGHVYSDAEALLLAVELINEHRPDFVVFLGDSIYTKKQPPTKVPFIESWSELRSILSKIEVPVHIVAGDHDTVDIDGGAEFFGERISPLTHAFSHERTTFIVLNSNHGRKPKFDVSDPEIELIRSIYEDDAGVRIILMHNALFPQLYIGGKGTPENRWNSEIVPLIKDRTLAVFTGNSPKGAPYSHVVIDGIDYYGIGFSNDPHRSPQHLFKVAVGDGFSVEPIPIRNDLTAVITPSASHDDLKFDIRRFAESNIGVVGPVLALALMSFGAAGAALICRSRRSP